MSRAQRIAFIAPRFPEGATVGGAETLLKNLANCAAAAGREVSFLTTCARNHFSWANEVPPGERTINGVKVHFFPVDEDRDIPTFARLQEIISRGGHLSTEDQKAWLANSVNSRPLCEYLRADTGKFDKIVAGPYLFGITYFAAAINPHKTVLVPCLHDEPFAYLPVIGEMFENVGGIMFNSEPERDLAARLYKLQSRRCFVVGMGITPFSADPSAFAARRGIDAPYVIYCGRREPLKGTPLLLDYVNAFRCRSGRDIKLVVTGSGPMNIPPELEPHVLDVGFLEEDEKHEAMAGAVAFCHPSRNESFSIVIMESWLAGTPVLVTAASDVMRDHCLKGNGGLWFRSYPEFEEELSALLDNSELRTALGKNGREYVLREYAWPTIEKKLFTAMDADVP
ncbi:MAG: glycosyltransferase family 4 protein [bacterium]